MSMCILSNDDLGSLSLIIQYLQYYLEEKGNSCTLILFNKTIAEFLAEYICVKNSYFNLKIDKMKYNKKKNIYTIQPRDILLNNLNEEEVAQYERDAMFVVNNVNIYSNIKYKNFDSISSLVVNNNNSECVFIHGYIKYLAGTGKIVAEGLEKIKLLESMIENDGRKLFFSSFLPSLDLKQRNDLKNYCVKTFSNVILCIDTRLLLFTKEEYEDKNYMTVNNKNENLIAYRLKLDGKVKIE